MKSVFLELAGQLQGHAQWIIEFAIKVASRIANLTVERVINNNVCICNCIMFLVST